MRATLAAEELFGRAAWIWTSNADAICHLRRVFAAQSAIKAAKIQVTADNRYELYVNGSFVGSDVGAESAVWQSVETYDIAPLLGIGENVVAVRATDLGGASWFYLRDQRGISGWPEDGNCFGWRLASKFEFGSNWFCGKELSRGSVVDGRDGDWAEWGCPLGNEPWRRGTGGWR